MSKLQAIRGMNDILPEKSLSWQYLENCFRQVVRSYGYQEIRFPVLEQTQLFKRSIGEVTDIVEKEMYSFDDRNGDNLSLRPEGTAGCVRAANQHGLLYNQQQRLWYQGPMFRHERPQKGRYRQFHQFGVEAFGMAGPDIDAEVIQLSATLWQKLDISQYLTLEINNIGSSDDRNRYSAELTAFLESKVDALDEDAKRRMHTNPLRVLDSKNPAVQAALVGAPVLSDFVNDESQTHYQQLKDLLRSNGLEFVENPRLVRGLDYYNNCVFEWTTDILGAQSAVCGGGRYDGLVQQLGGKPTVAAGFASGVERLVLMLEELGKVPEEVLKPIDVYIVTTDAQSTAAAMKVATDLRSAYPRLGIICHCGSGKYNSQLKKAYNCGARIAVIIDSCDGSDENSTLASARIRDLAEEGEAKSVELANISDVLAEML